MFDKELMVYAPGFSALPRTKTWIDLIFDREISISVFIKLALTTFFIFSLASLKDNPATWKFPSSGITIVPSLLTGISLLELVEPKNWILTKSPGPKM